MESDDINWKYNNQVSDNAAQNLALYGAVKDPFLIGMAKNETERLRINDYYDSLRKLPYTSGSEGIYWPGVKVIGVLFLIGLIIFGISTADYWEQKFMNAQADRVLSLQTAHYENLSPEAAKMSVQSTAKLYTAAFPNGEKSIFNNSFYDDQQKLATAAAWIRYTRDPVSFEKLPDKQRWFIFTTFEIYLQALANDGDINAVRDLRELSTPSKYKVTTPSP